MICSCSIILVYLGLLRDEGQEAVGSFGQDLALESCSLVPEESIRIILNPLLCRQIFGKWKVKCCFWEITCLQYIGMMNHWPGFTNSPYSNFPSRAQLYELEGLVGAVNIGFDQRWSQVKLAVHSDCCTVHRHLRERTRKQCINNLKSINMGMPPHPPYDANPRGSSGTGLHAGFFTI